MFTVPTLTYDYDALGATISADIMRLHHSKHHQAYVDKLNAALVSYPEYQQQGVTELIRQAGAGTLPAEITGAVRNHGGGHYNHSLFWQWMSPTGGGEPTGALARDIAQKYGSFQAFVEAFTAQALGVFGSGWAWLQPDLSITTTPNQDTPILLGNAEPLLGLDVWEHAYYLDYKNKRDDYVAAWWDVVDWDMVGARYQNQ